MIDSDVSKLTSEELENLADDFEQAQRQAFVTGFERGLNEAESMDILVDFLKTKRDKAAVHHDEHGDRTDLVRKLAYKNVLVKLSRMGVDTGGTE